jgi:hypothetical protein
MVTEEFSEELNYIKRVLGCIRHDPKDNSEGECADLREDTVIQNIITLL